MDFKDLKNAFMVVLILFLISMVLIPLGFKGFDKIKEKLVEVMPSLEDDAELLSVKPTSFGINDEVTLKFVINREVDKVVLRVYNDQGEVLSDFNYDFGKGEHSIKWDGKTKDNDELKPGIYFLELRIGEYKSSLEKGKVVKTS